MPNIILVVLFILGLAGLQVADQLGYLPDIFRIIPQWMVPFAWMALLFCGFVIAEAIWRSRRDETAEAPKPLADDVNQPDADKRGRVLAALAIVLILVVVFYVRETNILRQILPRGGPWPLIVLMCGISGFCVAVAIWLYVKGHTGHIFGLLLAAVGCIAVLVYVLWLSRWPPLMVVWPF